MQEAEHPRFRFFDTAKLGGARGASWFRNAQLGLFHDLTMKVIFALVSLLLPPVLAQIDPGNCTNFACNAVEQSAATCNSQESTEQGYANCLCTDVLVFAHLIFRKLTHRRFTGPQSKLESLRHRVCLCLGWYWKSRRSALHSAVLPREVAR